MTEMELVLFSTTIIWAATSWWLYKAKNKQNKRIIELKRKIKILNQLNSFLKNRVKEIQEASK